MINQLPKLVRNREHRRHALSTTDLETVWVILTGPWPAFAVSRCRGDLDAWSAQISESQERLFDSFV
jgi:hypothetical protein